MRLLFATCLGLAFASAIAFAAWPGQGGQPGGGPAGASAEDTVKLRRAGETLVATTRIPVTTQPSPTTVSAGSNEVLKLTAYFEAGTFSTPTGDHRGDAVLGPDSSTEMQNDGTMLLVGGWIYLGGYWPQVMTERVSASAVGSALVVRLLPGNQTDPNDDVEQFFFVAGQHAWVRIKPNGPKTTWSDTGTYAELARNSGTGNWEVTLRDLADAGNRSSKVFLDQAKSYARLAGVGPAGATP